MINMKQETIELLEEKVTKALNQLEVEDLDAFKERIEPTKELMDRWITIDKINQEMKIKKEISKNELAEKKAAREADLADRKDARTEELRDRKEARTKEADNKTLWLDKEIAGKKDISSMEIAERKAAREAELEDRKEARENETKIKLDENRKNTLIKGIEIGVSLAVGVATCVATNHQANKLLRFEENGSITSSVGKTFFGSLFRR